MTLIDEVGFQQKDCLSRFRELFGHLLGNTYLLKHASLRAPRLEGALQYHLVVTMLKVVDQRNAGFFHFRFG